MYTFIFMSLVQHFWIAFAEHLNYNTLVQLGEQQNLLAHHVSHIFIFVYN